MGYCCFNIVYVVELVGVYFGFQAVFGICFYDVFYFGNGKEFFFVEGIYVICQVFFCNVGQYFIDDEVEVSFVV